MIKLGVDTKTVIARFDAERQALALMDHPNIARVLDAGTTEAGRPYFVMELVRGVRITEYCDQKHHDPIPVNESSDAAKGIWRKPENALENTREMKRIGKANFLRYLLYQHR